MIQSIFRIILFGIFFSVSSKALEPDYKVFCFYDSRSFYRLNSGKVTIEDIEPALSHCTHLVYGFAGISSINYRLFPLIPNLDTKDNLNYYTKVTDLKKRYPHLKVLLSVGGGADHDAADKYLKLLDTKEARSNFIDSAKEILVEYGFDGINLAWQFPPNKGKKPHHTISSLWHKIKKTVTGDKEVDKDHVKHLNAFSSLVTTMKMRFSQNGLMVTASVLPNVKSSLFFEYVILTMSLDYVILHAYDFYTPNRNTKEADYAMPLKHIEGKYEDLNIDAVVMDWVNNHAPPNKIILGIPTFGRAWKLKHSEASGRPPVDVDGPAPEGPITKVKGLRSYYELCNSFIEDQPTESRYLFQNHDLELHCGPYAYRYTTENNRNHYGEWISYENVDDIAHKMMYIKEKKLAGAAVIDLSLDDFSGVCSEGKFPLLSAVARNLKN